MANIVLKLPALEFLDGKSYGIDGRTVGFMLHIRRDILFMLHGGHYRNLAMVFDVIIEKLNSTIDIAQKLQKMVSDLADLRLNQAEGKKKEELHKIREQFDNLKTSFSITSLVELQQKIKTHKNEFSKEEYEKITELLETCLIAVKEYFAATVRPFMGQARGTKEQMLVIIDEWCNRSERTKSQLLKWAETPEGNEMKAFDHHITSFKELEEFCDDLVHFLEALIRSCPKGQQQFKQMLSEQKTIT